MSVAGDRAGVCPEDEAVAWEVYGLAPYVWAALLEGEGPEVSGLAPNFWAALLEGEGPEVKGLSPKVWAALLGGEGPDLAKDAVADAYDAFCVDDLNGGDEKPALRSASPSGCANCPRALRCWRPVALGVAMMMLIALASACCP